MRTRVYLYDVSGIARLARVTSSTPRMLQNLLTEFGREARNTIIRRIRESKPTGREYARGRKVHTASAPGQPPARDTGYLVGHIFYEPGRVAGGAYYVDVGTTAVYGSRLEEGTRRMAARPWLAPALEETGAALADALAARYGEV